MIVRIALATSAEHPDLHEHDLPLVTALRTAGLESGVELWSDPSVDWSAYDAVLLRSVWDYHNRYLEFSEWLAQLDKAGVYGEKIVTRTDAATKFYPAEAYHQDFLAQNPSYPYIVVNDQPKIDNLKQVFPAMFRADAVLVADAKS